MDGEVGYQGVIGWLMKNRNVLTAEERRRTTCVCVTVKKREIIYFLSEFQAHHVPYQLSALGGEHTLVARLSGHFHRKYDSQLF